MSDKVPKRRVKLSRHGIRVLRAAAKEYRQRQAAANGAKAKPAGSDDS